MVALSNLRSRLKAVENIKKITTSMEMVASARLRKAQIKAKKAQYYVARTQEILDRLQKSSSDYQHPLMEKKKVIRKIAVVVVSSDRGLCGSYNTRIYSESDRFLHNHSHEEAELILLGRKAIRYYRKKKWAIRIEQAGWSGKMTFPKVKALSDELIQLFLSGEFDAIWIVYTQFHHLMDRRTVCEPFLPIGLHQAEEKKPALNYIIEPDLEQVYLHLLSRYCMNKIETILDQSYASELAARIFAMKSAANNAAEMETSLTLERNKVRQAQITSEILETISATG